MTPKNRIWELDAARGFCVLGMITVHFIFDLTELYPIVHLKSPSFFLLVKNWGGIAFFLISGICVTLGAASSAAGGHCLRLCGAGQRCNRFGRFCTHPLRRAALSGTLYALLGVFQAHTCRNTWQLWLSACHAGSGLCTDHGSHTASLSAGLDRTGL